jgi:hypothetical protein
MAAEFLETGFATTRSVTPTVRDTARGGPKATPASANWSPQRLDTTKVITCIPYPGSSTQSARHSRTHTTVPHPQHFAFWPQLQVSANAQLHSGRQRADGVQEPAGPEPTMSAQT